MSLATYTEELRNFIKDLGPLNRLLMFEEENLDVFLEQYLKMALDFVNAMPPLIGDATFDNFPMPSLLLHQATIECLISNSIVQARNDLTYNNGGVTVKVDDANRYLGILQNLYRMADSGISTYKQWKIAKNIEGGYGGIGSPYRYIGSRGRGSNGFNRLL